MMVICMNCRKLVGCLDEDKCLLACSHCEDYCDCQQDIPKGKAVIVEVMLIRYEDCKKHGLKHIGYV